MFSDTELLRFPPGQRRAVSFLRDLISPRSDVDDPRIPSVKQLAAAAGVSFKTMWKAVDAFEKRGIVECHPGQGIFLKSGGPVRRARAGERSVEGPLPRGVWRRIGDRIAGDILRGVHRPGARLPGGKELQRMYGVSFATLRKCLASLHRDGLIVAHGSSFIVKPLSPKSPSAKIVLIHAVDWYWGRKQIRFSQERFYEEFLRTIEVVCSRSSIALQVIFRSHENDECRYYDRAEEKQFDFSRDADVMGYVSEVRMLSVEALQQEMRLLSSLKKPVAVFNPGDEWRLPAGVERDRLTRIFRISSEQESGREIARLLLSLGHRRVAFISPYHGFDWSRHRLEGCVETYRAAGIGGGVVPCTLDYGRRRSFFDSVPGDHRPDPWMEGYRAWAKTVCPEYGTVLNPILEFAAYDGLVRAEIYRLLRPVFARVIEDASVTAWVCANDEVSLLASDFLQRNGKSVPRDVSVVGFDDSLDALNAGLGSYNFDIPSLVNAMLRYVLQHRQVSRLQRSRAEKIPGHVVMRGSIAAVR